MRISRKGFLQGIGCVAAGAAVGAFASRRPAPETPSPSLPPPVDTSPHGEDSFAQCGEDRIVWFLCGYLGISPIDYIDVGAHDPVAGNNTYLFYRMGHRGVLIEPNGTMCRKLRPVRPDDRVLEAGVGATAAREAVPQSLPTLRFANKPAKPHPFEMRRILGRRPDLGQCA